jgi:hypothetical protein
MADPESFIAEQIASSPPDKLSKNAVVVALQLGNIYLLMALVGLIHSSGVDQYTYPFLRLALLCCIRPQNLKS